MKKIWCVWLVCIVFLILVGSIILMSSCTLHKKVGLIEIKGVINSSRQIVNNIERCENNSNIGAIVVHIQSPGGIVVHCQEIYEALKEAKKPTVASLGDYAASGGYYIACGCNKIVSNPGTITGSIGVIMSLPNVSEFIKKVGLKFNVVKSRPHKDIGSPYRELTPKEHELLKSVVDDVYEQFVDVVTESRGLNRDVVMEISDGRILTGRQAFEIGLVDTLGTLHDAKLLAGSLAGIPGKPKVVEFRRPRPWWVELMKSYVADIEWLKLEYR